MTRQMNGGGMGNVYEIKKGVTTQSEDRICHRNKSPGVEFVFYDTGLKLVPTARFILMPLVLIFYCFHSNNLVFYKEIS